MHIVPDSCGEPFFYTDLTNAWMLAPDFKIIGEYERSIKEYPNIKVGEEFKGYNK